MANESLVRLKGTLRLLVFYLLLFIPIGYDPSTANGFQTETLSKQIKNMEIEQAVPLIKDDRQKQMLMDFKCRFNDGDSFAVTSHPNNFEIMVSHPSDDNSTGGAEQYFLDKNTGKIKVGWHEPPMPRHGMDSIDQN